MLRVRDAMTPNTISARLDTSLQAASAMMLTLNSGFLPVLSHERVIGLVTDRDIVLRGLAEGLDPREASVADVMTREVYTCTPDMPLEDALRLMVEMRLRRMPVVDEQRHLVGILYYGDALETLVWHREQTHEHSAPAADMSHPLEPPRPPGAAPNRSPPPPEQAR